MASAQKHPFNMLVLCDDLRLASCFVLQFLKSDIILQAFCWPYIKDKGLVLSEVQQSSHTSMGREAYERVSVCAHTQGNTRYSSASLTAGRP